MGLTAAGALQNFRVGVEALCRKARAQGPTCRLAVSPLTIIPPSPAAGPAGVTELSWDYAFIDADRSSVPSDWEIHGPWPADPPKPRPTRCETSKGDSALGRAAGMRLGWPQSAFTGVGMVPGRK
jgi:hypothetical protein